MSDAPDRDQKVFDPSPQRLKKAREEGNVFRSREVVAVAVLVASGGALVLGGPASFEALRTLMAGQLAAAAVTPLNDHALRAVLLEMAVPALAVLGPLFAAAFVAAGGANVAQAGLTLTGQPLQPKGNRISPAAGFKRIFSVKSLFEGAKAFTKAVVVLPLAYFTIERHLPELVTLYALPFDAVLPLAAGWILEMATQVLLALALLAGVDFAFEKYRYKKDLMMTFEEVKRESKDQDGDPHIKARRRQKAREMSRRPRLDHAVLKADVVVTNPTHYAVALQYDPAAGGAPVVLAKGIRKRALRIKALAAEHAVPTVENRPLARALHATVEEGDAIPETLYTAVAAVLAEVYRTRGTTAARSF